MGAFALQLREFAEKAKGNAHAVVRDVTAEIATIIDERSPVGDPARWKNPAPKGYVGGRFRANWQLGVGAIPSGVIDAVDPSGEATRGRVIASIPEQPAGQVLYLANNLPYAQRIEDGWSGQAPAGIVALTVVEFQSIVDRAVASVAK